MSEQLEFHPRIRIGVDPLGDPSLILEICTPPGTFVTADTADKIALQIVAAAAQARVRAGVVRDQLLAGVDHESAVSFANGLFGEPAT